MVSAQDFVAIEVGTRISRRITSVKSPLPSYKLPLSLSTEALVIGIGIWNASVAEPSSTPRRDDRLKTSRAYQPFNAFRRFSRFGFRDVDYDLFQVLPGGVWCPTVRCRLILDVRRGETRHT